VVSPESSSQSLDNVRLDNYKGMWQKYQNEDTNHSPNNDQ
jgi:hypothetical protein